MAQVTVPAEFFRGELRVYGDWRTAFIRELLQNSTDANPNHIEITTETVDGRARITFSDDGSGMNRDVLENVFFALGRTTKNDEGSIGGFGRARIILCFAQRSYEIRTGNLVARGIGGEYTIDTSDTHVKGCTFTVDLLDDDPSRIEDAIREVFETCTLRVPVTWNGQRVYFEPTPPRAARVLRDLNGNEWAKVYVTSGWGRVLVRVRGLTMFQRYLGGNDNVVVELHPRRSREVLSASRDTLHTLYGAMLDEFCAAMTQNRRKALKAPLEPLDLHVSGGGFLTTGADPEDETPVDDNVDDVAAHGPQHGHGHGGLLAASEGQARAAAYAGHASHPTATDEELAHLFGRRFAAPLGFDAFLLADAADTRVRKLTRAWNPAGWDGTTGRRRRQLLVAWKTAVEEVLTAFIAQHPSLGRVSWTVGWTFDEDVRAVHKLTGEGHVLALNPVDDAGRTRYQVTSKASRQQLIAMAAHEVCHIAITDHDEKFAAALTGLFGALDVADIDRKIRDAARS